MKKFNPHEYINQFEDMPYIVAVPPFLTSRRRGQARPLPPSPKRAHAEAPA